MKIAIYFHTVKHLKTTQIINRILKKILHPKFNAITSSLTEISGQWITYGLYNRKIFDYDQVIFLNHRADIKDKASWNNDNEAKLWLYNLHYFDDLCALDSNKRTASQLKFIQRWIDENPPAVGNGWEPYPTSLRIVNWIKSFLGHISPEQHILDSLAQQADFLSQDLETHILGNHLFVNAKALIFSGLYFDCGNAKSWLNTGLAIYNRELKEQVLNDGGNFELTPMYHAIMLVDLLDLINIFKTYPNKVSQQVIKNTHSAILKMLQWLKVMSHNDGEISFFNDSVFGIAPSNNTIYGYASVLGFKTLTQKYEVNNIKLIDLTDSGYVIVKSKDMSLIADLAAIGPDYIPGHAHADTLSFELSLGTQRIFVNSGISGYGLSEERLRQRQTKAHNTVSVDDLNSSQVWSGFRVAKRATLRNRVVGEVNRNAVSFSAEHDGFKKQGVNCIHNRKWTVTYNSLDIIDHLEGTFEQAESYLHLHPDVTVLNITNSTIYLVTNNYIINITVEKAQVSIVDTTWHPEFGISIPSKKLCFKFTDNLMQVSCIWSKK
ncbi:hypothetical protein PE36_06277 [Moritella sp. PE36]|uniref:heparinase II/III family protein n=1 Tax=Moritella sp. PE36 TaxID=58051 RepID=UPI0001568311|nr:heparinase II/III family protein [Moritella sp. PE36]EDM69070.1 hypothetical protein PE36_06277 [Moritella sp. PE36]